MHCELARCSALLREEDLSSPPLPCQLAARKRLNPGHLFHKKRTLAREWGEDFVAKYSVLAISRRAANFLSSLPSVRGPLQTQDRLILCQQQTTYGRAWRFFTTVRFPSSW